MILGNRFREFLPIVVIFVMVNAVVISVGNMLQERGVSQDVLLGGNMLLFGITFFSFVLAERGLQNKNPNAFVRAIYSSIMLKFFICILAAGIYIAINQKNINKPAFFTCMVLYLVYTFVEVAVLTRMLKRRQNE